MSQKHRTTVNQSRFEVGWYWLFAGGTHGPTVTSTSSISPRTSGQSKNPDGSRLAIGEQQFQHGPWMVAGWYSLHQRGESPISGNSDCRTRVNHNSLPRRANSAQCQLSPAAGIGLPTSNRQVGRVSGAWRYPLRAETILHPKGSFPRRARTAHRCFLPTESKSHSCRIVPEVLNSGSAILTARILSNSHLWEIAFTVTRCFGLQIAVD